MLFSIIRLHSSPAQLLLCCTCLTVIYCCCCRPLRCVSWRQVCVCCWVCGLVCAWRSTSTRRSRCWRRVMMEVYSDCLWLCTKTWRQTVTCEYTPVCLSLCCILRCVQVNDWLWRSLFRPPVWVCCTLSLSVNRWWLLYSRKLTDVWSHDFLQRCS